MPRFYPEGDGMTRRANLGSDDRQRDADIRDLITAKCPADEIKSFVRSTLRSGGRVILPCTCAAMLTTRIDTDGNAVVSHYTIEGKYEASTVIDAEYFGTLRGSLILHEWLHTHHSRKT